MHLCGAANFLSLDTMIIHFIFTFNHNLLLSPSIAYIVFCLFLLCNNFKINATIVTKFRSVCEKLSSEMCNDKTMPIYSSS